MPRKLRRALWWIRYSIPPGEIELAWTLNEDYDTVKLYHVYAVYADGSERFVSGAYADNLYIQNLEDRDQVVGLNLRAVGADGSESEPAFAALQTEGNVTNVRTVSRDGQAGCHLGRARGGLRPGARWP